MTRVGLISDTHGYLDESVFKHFENCDEVWHAGDVGNIYVLDRLEDFKPTISVYGNIDGQEVRLRAPEKQIFTIEGVKVYMIHIGGTPPRYAKDVLSDLRVEKPDLFICGHSHILKVMPDKNLGDMLYMNPGAAGHHGFHKTRTLLRFELNEGKVQKLEAIELGKRGRN